MSPGERTDGLRELRKWAATIVYEACLAHAGDKRYPKGPTASEAAGHIIDEVTRRLAALLQEGAEPDLITNSTVMLNLQRERCYWCDRPWPEHEIDGPAAKCPPHKRRPNFLHQGPARPPVPEGETVEGWVYPGDVEAYVATGWIQMFISPTADQIRARLLITEGGDDVE